MNMIKISALSGLFAAAAAFSGVASANVIGVKSVVITQNAVAYSEAYLQVAEVVATQAGTGLDVALASNGAKAVGSSYYANVNSSGYAIDGTLNADYPNIFHSAGGTSDSLTVTFAGSYDLSGFSVYGRSNCCTYRDVYDVRFYDAGGSLLYTQLGASANNAASLAVVDVPEPGSLALLAGGLLAAGVVRRRRKG